MDGPAILLGSHSVTWHVYGLSKFVDKRALRHLAKKTIGRMSFSQHIMVKSIGQNIGISNITVNLGDGNYVW